MHMRVAHQSGACTVSVAILLSIVASIVPLNHSRALAGEYGVHLAYSKPADANDGSSLIGGHVELAPSPMFGVVGAVDYRSEDVYNTSWGSLRARSIPVTLTGRFYLPMPTLAFTPFLEGGAGWYRVAYRYSGLLRSQLGLGVRF